ncbi:MAG: hypothetical protein JWM59_3974 [Verrucomicrobiales bacterium]|nr:hypothetical protein [Verrucomicrobiales bacterium]
MPPGSSAFHFPDFRVSLYAQENSPLKVGDVVFLEIRQTANQEEKPLLESFKLDHSGCIAVPGLSAPVAAKGLTPSNLTKSIAAAFRTEKQSAPVQCRGSDPAD